MSADTISVSDEDDVDGAEFSFLGVFSDDEPFCKVEVMGTIELASVVFVVCMVWLEDM